MTLNWRKAISILLALVMLVGVFTACGSQEKPAEAEEPSKAAEAEASSGESESANKEKSSVTVSLCYQPVTMNPHLNAQVWIWYYTDPMMGYLTNLSQDGSEIVPYVAESWTYNDDNTEVTFKLREDVYFHNDRQVTADDIVWTMNYVLDESVGNKSYAMINPLVERVEAISEFEVKFYLYAPSPGLLEQLSYVAILPQECIDTMETVPVGCGPYKFIRWDKDQQIIMEKYDKYFDADSIKTDEIVYRTFSDYNAEFAAFLAGEVQVMTQIKNVDLPTIQAQEDKYHTSASEGNKYFVNWNMYHDVAQNEKLREAVKYAVDREQIVSMAFAGNSYATTQFPATTSSWYIDELDYEPDVEYAKKCVEESGYDGSSILFIVPNTTAEGAIGEVVLEQLTAIGLNVEMQKIESVAFMDAWNNGRYDLAICGFGASLDPANLFDKYTTDYPTNIQRFGYSNKEYDALVTEGGQLNDFETRYEIYKEAMVLFMDDAFLNMLISETTYSAISNDVDGYVYRAGGRPDYTHIYYVG